MRQVAKYYAILGKQTFTPLDLSPALWLDAADATTITASSGAVSEWRDKSGNARHVSQGTAARQPTTGTRTQNGLNVLDFDGGDRLVRADAAALRPSTATVFAVVKLPDAPLSGVKSILANGNDIDYATNNYIFGINSASMAVLGRTPSAIVSGSALSASTSYVLEWVHSGSDVTARANGTLNINAAASTLGTDNTQGVFVGGDNISAYLWTSTIAEIIFYGSQLSASDLTKVRDYLTTKWGL